ncbi:hypothetical protein [Qipengyuania sp. MTN3-11]|uniref:hypothetical protein n=1 Tax=Qipengyuania sp. MTN3-11 TaxID=3056557 RepID=UPI0036F2D1B3
MIVARALPLPALLALAACGPAETDPGPGGVTVGEARALDEAAAMIDQRRTPAEALDEDEPVEEESAENAGE